MACFLKTVAQTNARMNSVSTGLGRSFKGHWKCCPINLVETIGAKGVPSYYFFPPFFRRKYDEFVVDAISLTRKKLGRFYIDIAIFRNSCDKSGPLWRKQQNEDEKNLRVPIHLLYSSRNGYY